MERQTLKCFKQPKFQNINVQRGHTSCTLSATFQHFWVVSPSVTCYNWGGFPERGSGVIRRGVISWVCGSVNGEHVCQITERFPSFYCLSATSLKKNNALQLLHTDITTNNIDIAFITETWFTTKQFDPAVTLNDLTCSVQTVKVELAVVYAFMCEVTQTCQGPEMKMRETVRHSGEGAIFFRRGEHCL